MQIIKTEGCTAYATTVDDKNILDCTFEEKKKMLHQIIENINDGGEYDIDVLFDTMAVHYGDYEYLYTCDECGDDVTSSTLEVGGKKISPKVINELIKESVDNPDDITDGYHTFGELYEYRKLYNAAFFNELYRQGKCRVHKSTKHSDGEDCFGGGWFIVMADLPTGQVSNHYEMKDWDLFDCEVRERADVWDGHTPQEAAKRIENYIKQS